MVHGFCLVSYEILPIFDQKYIYSFHAIYYFEVLHILLKLKLIKKSRTGTYVL